MIILVIMSHCSSPVRDDDHNTIMIDGLHGLEPVLITELSGHWRFVLF